MMVDRGKFRTKMKVALSGMSVALARTKVDLARLEKALAGT